MEPIWGRSDWRWGERRARYVIWAPNTIGKRPLYIGMAYRHIDFVCWRAVAFTDHRKMSMDRQSEDENKIIPLIVIVNRSSLIT